MKDAEKINLELTVDEFEQLLSLVYLGEWVANAHNVEDEENLFTETEQVVYAKAYDSGFNDLVEFDKEAGQFLPTEEFEEDMQTFVDEYDENTFIEELCNTLAFNEIEKTYEEKVDVMTDTELSDLKEKLFEKYMNLLDEHGVENLSLNE